MAYERVNWENLPSTNTPVNADNLNKMDKGIARTNTQTIDSDANLNDFTENGYYYFVAGHTYTNIPIGGNGWLEVINTGNTSGIKQIWYRDGTLNTNDYQTFVRTYSGGTWSNWANFATSQRWTQILLGFKYSFNTKKVVYAGTIVVKFTNGVANIDISDLNLSAKPDAVQITPSSTLYSIRYDYDNSSAQSIRVEMCNNGQIRDYTGPIRFSITIYGIEN